MTILITGAAGYVGSATAHFLSRFHEPPKMIGLDNLATGKVCPMPTGFTCYHGDVAHKQFVANLIKAHDVTQIVHCAAKVVVSESVERPLDYYQNNTAASLDLIEVAADAHVSMVFASTAAVYGDRDMRNRPLREDDECSPVSPYGQSKLMVEQFLRDVNIATGMGAVCLRYFNVAGADPMMLTGPHTEHGTHLIPRAVRAALGLIPKLLVYGDGSDMRDYVHVMDVAHANVLALDFLRDRGGYTTLNVANGQGVTVNEVIDTTVRVTERAVPLEFVAERDGDPASVVADISMTERRIGWRPQFNLQQMIETTMQWEQKKLPPR